jgi:hypothetical protein
MATPGIMRRATPVRGASLDASQTTPNSQQASTTVPAGGKGEGDGRGSLAPGRGMRKQRLAAFDIVRKAAAGENDAG